MKKFFFLLMSLTLCFSSCSKDNNEDPIIDEPTTQSHKGHEYVDLGLPSGTLWATCNVGANKPEDYGGFYAWAETETKKSYCWSTYKYSQLGKKGYYLMTKYCTSSDCGEIDNKLNLDSSDDAALINWGGNWRMPTKEEADELIKECDWKWTSEKGIKGCKITSKRNGNSIFLPAAGRYGGDYDIHEMDGVWLSYWTSSLYTEEPELACEFGYDADLETYPPSCDASCRYDGLPVRPVCKL